MPDAFGGIYPQPAAAIETVHKPPVGFDRNDLFLEQTRHFLQIAAGESAPICTLEDGIRVMELVVSATRSQSR